MKRRPLRLVTYRARVFRRPGERLDWRMKCGCGTTIDTTWDRIWFCVDRHRREDHRFDVGL